MTLIMFCGERQKSCTKFLHVCFYCWSELWWITEKNTGVAPGNGVRQKAPGGMGMDPHGLHIIPRSPRKWPPSRVPNQKQHSPSCSQKAVFIS